MYGFWSISDNYSRLRMFQTEFNDTLRHTNTQRKKKAEFLSVAANGL
jgi:hypothetical protein